MYGVGFEWVVGKIVWVGLPYHLEVALLGSVLDPMILHINGLLHLTLVVRLARLPAGS